MIESSVEFPNLADYFVATTRHFTNAVVLGLLPPVIFSILTWIALIFVTIRTSDDEAAADSPPGKAAQRARAMTGEEKSFVVAFAALGTLIGVFMGASRVGVVGAILPAVITLASGYLAYLFTRDTNVINRHIVPACIIALIFSASGGAFYGSSMRALAEKNDRAWEKHMIEFKEIQVPLNKLQLQKELQQPK
ncbi:MAG: hypothetical protein JJ900_03575 [Rhodospirillales bacterium]|nr:hypothetical protein [Rhodospirillales bacterium]MBO6785905.1 hypothetical protein [Rhodospirillales bacterium]